jgi:hypothetical protein
MSGSEEEDMPDMQAHSSNMPGHSSDISAHSSDMSAHSSNMSGSSSDFPIPPPSPKQAAVQAKLEVLLKEMAEKNERGMRHEARLRREQQALIAAGVRPKVFPLDSPPPGIENLPRRLEPEPGVRLPISNKMRMLRNITRSEDFLNDRRSTLDSMCYNNSGSSSDNDDDRYVYMYRGRGAENVLPIGRIHINDDDNNDEDDDDDEEEEDDDDVEQQRCSSPDMDFLEMDFDPGHSNDHDYSDDSDCCDMEEIESFPESNSREVDDFAAASSNSARLPGSHNSDVPSLAFLAKRASPKDESCNGNNRMMEVNHDSEGMDVAGVNTTNSGVINGNFSMGPDRNTNIKMPPSEIPPNDQVNFSMFLHFNFSNFSEIHNNKN